MLQDKYDFSPIRTEFELRLVGDPKPANQFPLISLAERLREAEKFIIGLENLLALSLDRERELNIDLAAIKTLNLGLRIDAFNYEIAITALEERRSPPPITRFEHPVISYSTEDRPGQKRMGIFGLLTGKR